MARGERQRGVIDRRAHVVGDALRRGRLRARDHAQQLVGSKLPRAVQDRPAGEAMGLQPGALAQAHAHDAVAVADRHAVPARAGRARCRVPEAEQALLDQRVDEIRHHEVGGGRGQQVFSERSQAAHQNR